MHGLLHTAKTFFLRTAVKILRFPFLFFLKRPNAADSVEVFTLTFMLAAKFQPDNKPLLPDEIVALEHFLVESFGFSQEERVRAFQAIRLGYETPMSYEDVARLLHRRVGNSQIALEALFDVFLSIVLADGMHSRHELRRLETLRQQFGLSEEAVTRLSTRHGEWYGTPFAESQSRRTERERPRQNFGSSVPRDYQLLGCKPQDSDATVKKRYRLLVKQLHPDRVVKSGMPPEFKAQAERAFCEVQEAWERIREARSL